MKRFLRFFLSATAVFAMVNATATESWAQDDVAIVEFDYIETGFGLTESDACAAAKAACQQKLFDLITWIEDNGGGVVGITIEIDECINTIPPGADPQVEPMDQMDEFLWSATWRLKGELYVSPLPWPIWGI